MPCVFCPAGRCPSDCPASELFPSDQPFSELSCVLARKILDAGFKKEFIMDCLRAAKVHGGLDLQKEFALMIILGHEFRSRALFGDLALKKKIISEFKEANLEGIAMMKSVEYQFNKVKDVANAAAVVGSSTTKASQK